MHDLRQRHCPNITPTLLCLKWPRLASLLWSHCQSECKITSKNKISHKVQLLACALMWKIFTPFLAPVNSREKDEHTRLLSDHVAIHAIQFLWRLLASHSPIDYVDPLVCVFVS